MGNIEERVSNLENAVKQQQEIIEQQQAIIKNLEQSSTLVVEAVLDNISSLDSDRDEILRSYSVKLDELVKGLTTVGVCHE